MIDKEKKVRRIYRLAPCPSYDVEGLEGWLTNMAQKGFLLAKDGLFATFEQGEPQNAKYRLEAAPKSTNIWADHEGEPDPEAIELSKKYDWTYIRRYGDFYIYRTFKSGARELNTDPEVQALALNAVRKRQAKAGIFTLLWFGFYTLLLSRGGIFLMMINMRTWFFLLWALIMMWSFAESLAEVFFLGKLQKKLRNDGVLESAKNWKKHTVIYHGKNILHIVLVIGVVWMLFQQWNNSVLGKDKIPIDDYAKNLPFATMVDFAGDRDFTYQTTMPGKEYNTICEWSDWLAAHNIEWNEYAEITYTDGKVIKGGLNVNYHVAMNPSIAKRLALEYYQQDWRTKRAEALEAPMLDVDYVVAYADRFHFPTIVIQKGNVVIHASFFQTSGNYIIDFEDWVSIMENSIF